MQDVMCVCVYVCVFMWTNIDMVIGIVNIL